jgi:hypothetical protein
MADFFDPRRVDKAFDKDATPGIKLDSGPYIGIIKNNADSARLGRLKVYIPDLGGDETDRLSWWTVTYASPFYGATTGTNSAADANFGTERHTYGFWAVPPDLDNQVLCTFVGGDPSRGFWFACIPNSASKQMIPGISRGRDFNDGARGQYVYPITHSTERELTKRNVYLPNSEINLNNVEKDTRPDYLTMPRVVHPFQAETVIQQGLETDKIRGTVTSNSQRETPSFVFGMSTPGRAVNDLQDRFKTKQAIDAELNKTDTTISSNQYTARKGGHTFIMDDGDVYGDSNLVRLRTAGGHTILMHDTENIIYITNKQGNSWIELTPNGAINVYGSKSFSLRSEANVNIHSDANVNIHAGDSINCYAGNNIETETTIKRERVKELYNIDTGNYGLLVGNESNIKTLTGHITTTDTLRIKSGATSGWNVASGEMWLTGGTDIHLNTGGKTIPDPKQPISNAPMEQYQKQDVYFNAELSRWIIDDRTDVEFESIAPFTPTHEPWSRETGPRKLNDGTLIDSQPQKDD